MYNVVVCLLTLSFLLLTGLSNTAEARVPYEASKFLYIPSLSLVQFLDLKMNGDPLLLHIYSIFSKTSLK